MSVARRCIPRRARPSSPAIPACEWPRCAAARARSPGHSWWPTWSCATGRHSIRCGTRCSRPAAPRCRRTRCRRCCAPVCHAQRAAAQRAIPSTRAASSAWLSRSSPSISAGRIGRQLQRLRHQRLPERVPLAPTLDARHTVPRQHRLAIVEPQSLAQAQAPLPPVSLDGHPLNHLRLHRKAAVLAVGACQTMEPWLRVTSTEVQTGSTTARSGLRDEAQHSIRLGSPDRRHCQRCGGARNQ